MNFSSSDQFVFCSQGFTSSEALTKRYNAKTSDPTEEAFQAFVRRFPELCCSNIFY